MRKFFKRFFHAPKLEPVEKPDDWPLERALTQATEKHKRATIGVKTASIRQLQEADYIRETLQGVLSRIEERKAEGNNDGEHNS